MEITLAGLWRSQAQAPHYFFRKKSSTSLFLQKKWGASLFLQKKISVFVWRNIQVLHFFKEILRCFIFSLQKSHSHDNWGHTPQHVIISWDKNEAPRYFFRKNEAPHYFFTKKISSLFWRNNAALQFFSEEIMRPFIFFCTNNEAIHLFLKKWWSTWFFLKKQWGDWACYLNNPANVISA